MTQPAIPRGFRFAGVHCGVKTDPAKEDLTLIVSDQECVAAGVYTKNVVHSASVAQNRAKTPGDRFRAVVVNSGNANACTGPRGDEDCHAMARQAGEVAGATGDQALVMSTGIIGEYLPMDLISAGIASAASQLASDNSSLIAAARGMTTTDISEKVASRTIDADGRSIQVTGMAKGAGMIGPNMATMLAVVMTDAKLTPDTAQQLLTAAADESFNCISVEGHMSTSDTVLLLASGEASDEPLTGTALDSLRVAVTEVCIELAKMIPADGEGASHLITLDVSGCASRNDAHQIAKTVADSALVKTGIAGADPNWGRVISAAGYAGVPFDPAGLSLSINGTRVYDHGTPVDFDLAAVSKSIRDNRDTHLELSLTEGDASVRFWTSDLTVDYVRFNSEYTT